MSAENIWLHNEINSLIKSTAYKLSQSLIKIYGLVLQDSFYFKMCYLNYAWQGSWSDRVR